MEKYGLSRLVLSFLLGGLLMYAFSYRQVAEKPSFPLTVKAADNPNESLQKAMDVQEAFRQVSAKLSASVVKITVEMKNLPEDGDSSELPWDDFFNDPEDRHHGLEFFRSRGMGSGVIVERQDNEYFIVTNLHVIGGADSINIFLYNGIQLTGNLVDSDERKDLALISTEFKDETLPVASFGNSDELYVGDWVLAVGCPFGYENSVTQGIISAVERYSGPNGSINGFIQTDAAINQGSSGGPLVNLKGEIIGINTFISTPSSGNIGLGFAIPSNNVQPFVQRLIEFGDVRYGWLGASLGLYDAAAAEALGYPVNHGVMVYQVFIGSPAEKAKLQPGDLILSLDGQRYTDDSKLIYQIGDKEPGSKAVFRIERFGEEREIIVTLGKRQKEEDVYAMHGFSWPGFVPAPLNDSLRKLLELPDSLKGVPVAIIYPHSPSQAVDLRVGDVITRVGSTDIDSIQGCYLALGAVPKDKLEFTIYRNGEEINLK